MGLGEVEGATLLMHGHWMKAAQEGQNRKQKPHVPLIVLALSSL